ncbi:Hypothetical predicted protein [Octopus vulgaris]|uniref:Uncharacterized protein n=1 Tax=Octopus vulgaris TaxID=6645 RepID=A0AA36BD38_OCTVU|nr:Hypothetical predicted protein [Octopus vulgaris]
MVLIRFVTRSGRKNSDKLHCQEATLGILKYSYLQIQAKLYSLTQLAVNRPSASGRDSKPELCTQCLHIVAFHFVAVDEYILGKSEFYSSIEDGCDGVL